MHRFTLAVLAVAGVFNVFIGAWAFLAPISFFDYVATFPPYNEHLLHDAGAFQIGLGVSLLAALRWSDAAFVVLLGAAAASVVHLASHVMDTHLGGQPGDFVVLGLLAAVVVAAAIQRGRMHATKEGRS